MSGHRLTRHDRDLHQRLGIDVSLLEAAGVCRVTDHEARNAYGITGAAGTLDGIFYPHNDAAGKPRSGRLRRDAVADGQSKYVAISGRHALAFPPDAVGRASDANVPLVFVESVKAMLSIEAAARRARRDLLPIALGGVDGWRGKNGLKETPTGKRVEDRGPLPDFDALALRGREVVILFDSNVTDRADLRRKRDRFAEYLASLGARIRVGTVPALPAINGPDDYRAANNDDALLALIDDAFSWTPPVNEWTVGEILEEARLADADLKGLTLEVFETRIAELGELIEGCPVLRRATVAETLRANCRDNKLSGASKLIDHVFRLKTPASQKAGAMSALPEDAAWPDPVDGVSLLGQTKEFLDQHVSLPPSASVVIALWIAFAWTIDAFGVAPRLVLSSPTKRCGKTLLLSIIAAFVPRALPASNITGPGLFRAIEQFKPTMLLDESETYLKDNETLRGLLNAGHYRATANVLRCVGEDLAPKVFSCWCPMVLALIGTLPDTIRDRSFEIRMQRKRPEERLTRLRLETLREALASTRQRWARWAADAAPILGQDPIVPHGLHDRAADNARPLLAIADAIGGAWPSSARAAIVALSGCEEEGDQPTGVQLLVDLYGIFEELHVDRLTTEAICERLRRMNDRPWGAFGRTGGGITGHALGRFLSPFGVRPSTQRFGERERLPDQKSLAKGYLRSEFAEAWRRYAPQLETTDGRDPASSVGELPTPALAMRNAVTAEACRAEIDAAKRNDDLAPRRIDPSREPTDAGAVTELRLVTGSDGSSEGDDELRI